MPSSCLAQAGKEPAGKMGSRLQGQIKAGSRQAGSSLGANKRSKASFKSSRGKENVDPRWEAAAGNLLEKSKVELCSLEKRLRCFRHQIGESKVRLVRAK